MDERKFLTAIYIIGLVGTLVFTFYEPKTSSLVLGLILLMAYGVVGYVVFIWKK